MDKPISVLPLSLLVVRELQSRGYHTLVDLEGLDALQAIAIPGMNGRQWQIICKALRRKPFPDLSE